MREVLEAEAGANFHTWAVWGSRKAGVTIRHEGLDRALREVTILALCAGLLTGFLLGLALSPWLPGWVAPALLAVGASKLYTHKAQGLQPLGLSCKWIALRCISHTHAPAPDFSRHDRLRPVITAVATSLPERISSPSRSASYSGTSPSTCRIATPACQRTRWCGSCKSRLSSGTVSRAAGPSIPRA
jgi:hypothetical protein